MALEQAKRKLYAFRGGGASSSSLPMGTPVGVVPVVAGEWVNEAEGPGPQGAPARPCGNC